MTDITDFIRPYRVEPFNWLTAVRERVNTWRRRDRNRAYLARASAHELADMGLSSWQRQREVSKSFWVA